MHKTHGLSKSPLYKLWATVKNRCYNINEPSYEYYGAKGVSMCDEWRDNPVSFMEWCKNNGWAKGLQIDKDIIAMGLGLNPNIYSPERCQFVTRDVNMGTTGKTRYIEYNGKRQSLIEWSRELGIPSSTLLVRIDMQGYSIEKAFIKKDNRVNFRNHRNVNRVFTFNGKTQSIPKWSKELGISSNTLNSRITSFGWSIDKAFTTPLNNHKNKK